MLRSVLIVFDLAGFLPHKKCVAKLSWALKVIYKTCDLASFQGSICVAEAQGKPKRRYAVGAWITRLMCKQMNR